MSYQVTLEDMVKGPFLIKQFYRTNTDEELVRFGYLFQLFDSVPLYYETVSMGWALPQSVSVFIR